MKPEEINKAIAEAMGWTIINDTLCDPLPVVRNGVETGDVDPNPVAELPNFSGSLDAMAEARKNLCGIEPSEYCYQLIKVLGFIAKRETPIVEIFALCNATAAEHAEAFCRAKGIWKD